MRLVQAMVPLGALVLTTMFPASADVRVAQAQGEDFVSGQAASYYYWASNLSTPDCKRAAATALDVAGFDNISARQNSVSGQRVQSEGLVICVTSTRTVVFVVMGPDLNSVRLLRAAFIGAFRP